MAANKVIVNNQTILDLTADTVTAATLKKGVTAHDASGTQITGTLESGGGGGGAVSPKDINFYDYDGTCVAAWSLSELAGKTALPDYPTHEGLTCQGWNWMLEGLKAENAKMNVGAMYITTDRKTRIYITLQEGRTSPMLGICPNGTVTVDWGDGTTPDTLTGTSTATVVWTPTHNYAAPGDYVIALSVEGTFGLAGNGSFSSLLRYANETDSRNYVYLSAIQRVELGSGIGSISEMAFRGCSNLTSITMPSEITIVGRLAFGDCSNLTSITLPGWSAQIGSSAFSSCESLASISLPIGGAYINDYAFQYCRGLTSIAVSGSIGSSAFAGCTNLVSITMPNNVSTSIYSSAFSGCRSLSSIALPRSVTSIAAKAFQSCSGMAFYDFTACTAVPTLAATSAFTGIPADCEIRVPAALLDEWKAATNWATYANQIVGV